jgi:hypothetical protein
MIFTGERSWSKQSHPRDRVLQSLWYLSTTLWRATRPRRKQIREAPEIAGQWRATYGGHECLCVGVSALGARIRLPQDSLATVPLRGRFRLELQNPGFVEADAALGQFPEDISLITLEFRWRDFTSMRAFFALCVQTSDNGARPKRPFWGRWVEDLR